MAANAIVGVSYLSNNSYSNSTILYNYQLVFIETISAKSHRYVHDFFKLHLISHLVVLERSYHAHSKTGFSYVLPVILRKLHPNNQENIW